MNSPAYLSLAFLGNSGTEVYYLIKPNIISGFKFYYRTNISGNGYQIIRVEAQIIRVSTFGLEFYARCEYREVRLATVLSFSRPLPYRDRCLVSSLRCIA